MNHEFKGKLSRILDDFESGDPLFSKDIKGHAFSSMETDTNFILNAHLPGFKRGNVKVGLKEDGTILLITCEKPIKETVSLGWNVHKQVTRMRGFRRGFRIPRVVVTDQIMAKFSEIGPALTITMPKAVEGVLGVGIQELTEQDIGEVKYKELNVVDENEWTGGRAVQQRGDQQSKVETESCELEEGKAEKCDGGQREPMNGQQVETTAIKEEDDAKKDTSGDPTKMNKPSTRKCVPILLVGSALLASLIVLASHSMRTKNQSRKNEKDGAK